MKKKKKEGVPKAKDPKIKKRAIPKDEQWVRRSRQPEVV